MVALVVMSWATPVLADPQQAPEAHVYKTVDGTDLKADVYQPRSTGDEAGPSKPTILWLHGGALVLGSRHRMPEQEIQFFVDAGYRVVVPDYRLAPEAKLEAILGDLDDVYAWLHTRGPEELGVDASRIVVMGQSAGGYLALVAGYRFQPRPMAVVAFYGYGRLEGSGVDAVPVLGCVLPPLPEAWTNACLSPRLPGPLAYPGRVIYAGYLRFTGHWTRALLGDACVESGPACVSRFNPEENITPHYPPTMLVHGMMDVDVPVEESLRVAKQLEKAGVEHQLVQVPWNGHGFDLHDITVPAVAESLGKVIHFLEQDRMRGSTLLHSNAEDQPPTQTEPAPLPPSQAQGF